MLLGESDDEFLGLAPLARSIANNRTAASPAAQAEAATPAGRRASGVRFRPAAAAAADVHELAPLETAASPAGQGFMSP